MEFWVKTCILLCSYGFFKEVRPSESLLTEYMLGPYQNLTQNEIYSDVYPVWTYSYLSLLVVVFLFTDLLRYKPVIVFEGLGYVGTWSILLWAHGLHWMQAMEFVYGIATSTEVAYFTYMYAQVDNLHYQRVTGYARAALLTGRFLSGLLSQVLSSSGLLDAHSLNYISLASVTVALVIAIHLPPVKNSIYFHRAKKSFPENGESDPAEKNDYKQIEEARQEASDGFPPSRLERIKNYASKLLQAFGQIWSDFKDAYSSHYLLRWSLWWAFATCMNFQVGNYIQALYESLAPFQETEKIYNGATDAVSTLLGALSAFGISYLHLNWELAGEITIAVISLVDTVLLVTIGMTSHILVAYINYVLFRASYQALITVASYQVARNLKADSYGLVFGFNMFLALLIQTLVTVVVNEWLEIEPSLQFIIYGGYFGVLTLIFSGIAAFHFGTLHSEEMTWRLWLNEPQQTSRNA